MAVTFPTEGNDDEFSAIFERHMREEFDSDSDFASSLVAWDTACRQLLPKDDDAPVQAMPLCTFDELPQAEHGTTLIGTSGLNRTGLGWKDAWGNVLDFHFHVSSEEMYPEFEDEPVVHIKVNGQSVLMPCTVFEHMMRFIGEEYEED